MAASIQKRELKEVVRESVREAFTEELMRMRALFLPFVSSREQKDIERRYGKPSRKVAQSMEIRI